MFVCVCVLAREIGLMCSYVRVCLFMSVCVCVCVCLSEENRFSVFVC